LSNSKQLIIKAQRIALYLFFFSINFEVWDPFNTGGFFSVSKLTGWIYLFSLMPAIRYFNVADVKNPFFLSAWFYFIILTLVSIININNISFSFIDFTVFQNIFLFWVLFNHERKDSLILEKGMLSFALGSIALALLFNAGIGIEYEDGRVTIFGDNENIIGLRMSISLAILILNIAQNRLKLGWLRYLLILPIPIMVQFMIETGSRVALISFVLIIITGVVLFKTKNVFSKIIAYSVGAIISTILIIYIMQSETLLHRILITTNEGEFAGRDLIWRRLLPLIESNPIIGVGKTGYDYFSQITFGGFMSPHNVILEVLCYSGIIGLMVYLYFLYRIFKRGYHKYMVNGLLLPLLLLIPVLGMLVSGQILGVKIGWIIFAYIVGGSVLRQNQGQFVAGHHENDTAP